MKMGFDGWGYWQGKVLKKQQPIVGILLTQSDTLHNWNGIFTIVAHVEFAAQIESECESFKSEMFNLNMVGQI